MNKTIIISRTDAIGDVVLTIPMAQYLKKKFPDCKIIFLGTEYTKPVINIFSSIDDFISKKDFSVKTARKLKADAIIHVYPDFDIAFIAQNAGINLRIGTASRWYHWLTCNKLVKLSRRKSSLHEAQLNFKLLLPLNINKAPSLEEIKHYYFGKIIKPLDGRFSLLLNPKKFNLILHPKSHSSAREWSLDNYSKLINLLHPDRYRIFISGTEKEKPELENFIEQHRERIIDLTGKFNLSEFISFIKSCDGVIAASTGPLHIAAALGKTAIGIFPPIKPIDAVRWGPVGKRAHALSVNRECNFCRTVASSCVCINKISAEEVYEVLLRESES